MKKCNEMIRKSKYRFTNEKGESFVASPMEAAARLGVTPKTADSISTYARKRMKMKGWTVECIEPQQKRTYSIMKDDTIYTGMLASNVAEITGIKSNAVSVYAKYGSLANGWRIATEQKGDVRKLRFQPAAGFRCFECVLHTMESECRKHPCAKPKGYYVFE